MTEHCRECGSQICNHGNCPECNPCNHCYGGDRTDKYFGEQKEDSEGQTIDQIENYYNFERGKR